MLWFRRRDETRFPNLWNKSEKQMRISSADVKHIEINKTNQSSRKSSNHVAIVRSSSSKMRINAETVSSNPAKCARKPGR